ncbi:MAG: tyrosine-protein phosphatase [Deltaproteobacteria bacterium]|nr:tyrosine-protein phosphatase [Deltaproteobacteria bacterium]
MRTRIRRWRRRALATLAAALLLAAALVLGVRLRVVEEPRIAIAVDRLWARNFGVIEPGVYRGGQPSAVGRRWLWDRYHFKTVIHLAWRETEADLEERAFFEAVGADYRIFAWQPEGPPTTEVLEGVLEAVRDAPRPVFVHCIGGTDRTGGIAGLLEIDQGKTLSEIAKGWSRFGTPSRGWQRVLREAPPGPLHPFERTVREIADVHGTPDAFAVAGYRMARAALERMDLKPGDADLALTYRAPRTPPDTSTSCASTLDGVFAGVGVSLGRLELSIAGGPPEIVEVVFRRRSTGQAVAMSLQPHFISEFVGTPELRRLDAGQRVLRMRDDEIFHDATATLATPTPEL